MLNAHMKYYLSWHAAGFLHYILSNFQDYATAVNIALKQFTVKRGLTEALSFLILQLSN